MGMNKQFIGKKIAIKISWAYSRHWDTGRGHTGEEAFGGEFRDQSVLSPSLAELSQSLILSIF